MKERPILFNAPMVHSLLNCTKSQTRRVVKPQHIKNAEPSLGAAIERSPSLAEAFCPYGQPGDRLWVRESGWERPERTAKMMREGADTWPRFAYAADGWSEQDRADFRSWGFKPRPSIHMPRWASRILLEIASIAVFSILRDWIKGQVMAIETGILSFEGAFLGQLMLPSGKTVLETVTSNKLLPNPEGGA